VCIEFTNFPFGIPLATHARERTTTSSLRHWSRVL
jgi:hypothetical protein